MSQTTATREALERDQFVCQYHRIALHQPINVFAYQDGCAYYAGGHHVFGRAILDTPETIIGLCCRCHWRVEHAVIPKSEMVAVMSSIVGVDLYRKYRSLCKWDDDEWLRVCQKIGLVSDVGSN